MTNIVFRFPGFLVAFAILIMAVFSVSFYGKAFAQYHGAYSAHSLSEKENKKEKPAYPQIFSSQVGSVQQAVKLDEIYDDLYASLWNCAISDFNYQKQLYALLDNENFQITRYFSEFSGLLESSMDNLNKNYKKVENGIETAQRKYEHTLERMREIDKETTQGLWKEKIAEYKAFSDKYFETQNLYLQTYRKLVAFILAQGGRYYYSSDDRSIRFYKNGAYEYYAQMVDTLHKTSYEQRKLLKSHIPVSIDSQLLKSTTR